MWRSNLSHFWLALSISHCHSMAGLVKEVLKFTLYTSLPLCGSLIWLMVWCWLGSPRMVKTCSVWLAKWVCTDNMTMWHSTLQLLQVILRFAAYRFSIIVSDTTGNVKKCRRLICEKWPWILNCPDPCHQLNLMMKDIMLGSKKFPKIKGLLSLLTSHMLCNSTYCSQWQLFQAWRHTSHIATMVNISSNRSSRRSMINVGSSLVAQQDSQPLLLTLIV